MTMKKKSILIVEDEPVIAFELSDLLEGEGYRVLPVLEHAEDVLKAYITHHPDLVIMDIHLKGYTDGIDAVRRLKLLAKELPVIFITAYNTDSTKSQALKTMPTAYLTKPIHDGKLLSTIQTCFA